MAQLLKAEEWQDQDGIDTTRRFPRTLEQAFGSHERGGLQAPAEPVHPADKVVLVASAVGSVTLILLAVLS